MRAVANKIKVLDEKNLYRDFFGCLSKLSRPTVKSMHDFINDDRIMNENTPIKIANKIIDCASFDFNKVNCLKPLFERRQYIAMNYKPELKEEFDYLNDQIRNHLHL